jgi:alpha-L-fucosidase
MSSRTPRPLIELLKLKPGIIHNNRLGGGFRGDTETPEQHIPATGFKDRDWETCMTMNKTWGYKSYDHRWKSTEVLLRNLVDIVSKGGNYLLNIGPKKDGTIPEASIERLEEFGVWMKRNGEAIYGTEASPCDAPSWGRVTTKRDGADTILYLHVFDWPEEGKLQLGIENEIKSCSVLTDPAVKAEARLAGEMIVITVEGVAPDPICSVIKLGIKGEPVVTDPPVVRIKQRRSAR